MSFSQRLTHQVAIVRQADTATLDDHGQPVTTDAVLRTVAAAIQPRSSRERLETSQAGAAVSDHVIFLFPTDVTTADAIVHDDAVCPVGDDLPSQRFEIVGVPNAAGLSHHLEIEARLVEAATEAAVS